MPAAAVIPAPIAYTKVVAVKKLVVEFLVAVVGRSHTGSVPDALCPSSEFFRLALSCWADGRRTVS